jgi:hypothetical protein
MSTDKNMHICLDNVYYPLDFDKLGINRIEFPVALRFSLSDGLFPTPNRESLRYTPEAKKIINNKLTEVANYLVAKYNDNIAEGSDIKSVINHLEKSGYYVEMASGFTRNIEPFVKFSTITPLVPKIEGIKLLDFTTLYKSYKQNILEEAYPAKFSLYNKRMHNVDKHSVYGYNLQSICNGSAKVYVYKDRVSGIKKDYLRATCDQYGRTFLSKPAPDMRLGVVAKYRLDTYYHLLQLNKVPKAKWREIIKEYQYIISLIVIF